MKNRIEFLMMFLVIAFLVGCNKDTNDSGSLEAGQIKLVIDGKNYKSLSIDNFDILNDTTNWNLAPNGVMKIDTVDKFNGKSSVYLKPTEFCFVLEKIKGIDVVVDKVYVIHFYYKFESHKVGDVSINTCGSAEFAVKVKQADKYIVNENLSGVSNWTEKYFYFKANSNVPVKIELIAGTDKGIHLDDLIVLSEY